MENFHSLGLPEALLNSLQSMQFTVPTPIQAQTIPHALLGLDVLGSAQTGTGKTAAYGIPLVSFLINNPQASALILLPTRELAAQVLASLKQMIGHRTQISTSLLIGGDSMFKQLNQLRNKPRLVVGTPGRINDHLERRTVKFDTTQFLVLDETDRMLDMGFSVQIQEIIKYLPKERQTLMFSATMAPEIVKTAQTYLKNAVRVSVGSTTNPVEKIKQESLQVNEADKFKTLLEQLETVENSCIVFVKTKFGADKLAHKLDAEGFIAEAIHGDLRQSRREKVIKSFRDGKCQILVATDIAARGLDVPSIECVVNYDLPMAAEDYIHRIGRTGRAGKAGRAISFVANSDYGRWRDICRLLNKGLPANEQMEAYGGGQDSSRSGYRGGNRGFSSSRGRSGGSSFGGNRSGSSFGGDRRGGSSFGNRRNSGGGFERKPSHASDY